MIAIKGREGIIIDPTVRFEKDVNQPKAVHEEKVNIYTPTIDFFKDKYKWQNPELTNARRTQGRPQNI